MNGLIKTMAAASIWAMASASQAMLVIDATGPGASYGETGPDQNNDILPSQVNGWFGANIWVEGDTEVSIELVGYEAGWNSWLHTDAGSLNNKTDVNGSLTFNASTGWLDFTFEVNPHNDGNPANNTFVNNGENIYSWVKPDFFVSEVYSDAKGDWFYLLLDDGGAGPDDNHDDWVGKVYANHISTDVPEPGTIALLAIGLAGIGLVRRRERANA